MLSQWSALMVLVTLTFDLLTLKLVYGSHKRWGNLHSEFRHARPSGSRVIRYVRDGRTDGRTDRQTDKQTKSNAYCLLPYGWGHNNGRSFSSDFEPFSGFENWSSQWLSKGPFIATQLNSTQLDVELS